MNLNQITLPSTDLATASVFYQKLGFRLIVDSIPRYARFECPVGEATFSLHHVDKVAEGAGVVIYFEHDDLDQWVAELERKGIVFDSLPEDKSWLWREAHLRDPDGNQLILFHAGENRKNPPWRVQS